MWLQKYVHGPGSHTNIRRRRVLGRQPASGRHNPGGWGIRHSATLPGVTPDRGRGLRVSGAHCSEKTSTRQRPPCRQGAAGKDSGLLMRSVTRRCARTRRRMDGAPPPVTWLIENG